MNAQSSATPIADRVAAAEHDAYVALEECRLRCERLVAARPDVAVLRHIHRDLGLAGYQIGSHLLSDARHQSLAQARERCGGEVTDVEAALRDLGTAVDRAMVAVEFALDATVLADHAQLAQVHLIDADAALSGLGLGARR